MKKNSSISETAIIAETSHFSSDTPEKKGLFGIISMPFKKITNSTLFFKLSAKFSLRVLITVLSALIIFSLSVAAVVTHDTANDYHKLEKISENTKAAIRTMSEIRSTNAPAVRSPIIPSSDQPPVLIDVPFYSQKDYPTGCELVSTSMLLAFYGISISANQLITDGYVKTKSVYLNKYRNACGPDPDIYFIGDPLKDTGYGCYSGTIISALKKILPSDKYNVCDLKNMSIDKICENYIDNGIPVMIWGSINMKPTYVYEINHWVIDEGKKNGTDFWWRSNEHCLIFTGYDNGYYYFNDPLSDESGTKYRKWQVKKRFGELGNMAVAIEKK